MSASESTCGSISTKRRVSLTVSAFTLPACKPAYWPVSRLVQRSVCHLALQISLFLASQPTDGQVSRDSTLFLEVSHPAHLLACQPVLRLLNRPLNLPVIPQKSRPSLLLECHPACRLVPLSVHSPVCCNVSQTHLLIQGRLVPRRPDRLGFYQLSTSLHLFD